ncbi:MAG: hypothetical protein LBN06_04575 [Prevotellaceae bacterium]|jgi:DNA mismatch repair ATPase MutS|nr:hypothetical protein [Prevotellaceae bacterium]
MSISSQQPTADGYEPLAARYRQRADEASAFLRRIQKEIYRTGTLRLLLFIAGVGGVIYLRTDGWVVIAGVIAVTLIPFLWLIKYHTRLFHRKEYLEQRIAVNEQELAALQYDHSAFGEGAEFIDATHPYSFDLDLFGARSLFQSLNRTVTEPGKRRLAAWMNRHLTQKAEIIARQQAVQALTDDMEFRQEFRIRGLLYKGEAADEAELTAWAESPVLFRKNRWLRILPLFVTSVNVLMLVSAAFGIGSFGVWGGVWTLFVLAGFGFTHTVSKMQQMYGKKLQILGTYAHLLRLMEEQGKSNLNASYPIARLSRLMNALDQRNNMFMYAILNGLFFWEIRQVMRIEKWKEDYAAELPRWLEAIGNLDALCSLATFACNHPDYIYPTLTEQSFRLQAEALGHPLMNRDTCVRNDIDISRRPAFLIITGANMAGKSTYLRTVGVNYLLACMGAPVCARRMEIYPARLVTSLRTSDSLTDNESYFFAELKRLKMIIDKLQAGEELFIILDEILKGTNSVDKQKGSLALVTQFMALQADGIIATHDLMLGTLANTFPGEIRNYCFEADITNNELTFSYRLREGVAQNMNACFLMNKMGITNLPLT